MNCHQILWTYPITRDNVGPMFSATNQPAVSGNLGKHRYSSLPKMWDAESGQELLTLRGHSGAVWGVAFSPDGKPLATASVDKTVQVYALDVRELLDLALSRVTRTFPYEECQRYFQSEACPPLP